MGTARLMRAMIFTARPAYVETMRRQNVYISMASSKTGAHEYLFHSLEQMLFHTQNIYEICLYSIFALSFVIFHALILLAHAFGVVVCVVWIACRSAVRARFPLVASFSVVFLLLCIWNEVARVDQS